MIIRANEDDIPIIVSLNSLFHIDMPKFKWDTESQIKKHLYNYFILREKGKIIGAICIMLKENRQCAIETISVDLNNQHKGFGKELIEFAKGYAIKNQCKKLIVNSFHKYNLLRFYEGLVFSKKNKEGIYKGHKYYEFYVNLQKNYRRI